MSESKARPTIAITIRVAVARLNEHFSGQRTSLSRSAGLTHGEFSALVILGQRQGGVGLGELARILSVKAPNLTVTARSLEGKGLARREASSDDKRSARLAITLEGSAMLRRLLPEEDRLLSTALGRLSDDELATLAALLRKMRADDGRT